MRGVGVALGIMGGGIVVVSRDVEFESSLDGFNVPSLGVDDSFWFWIWLPWVLSVCAVCCWNLDLGGVAILEAKNANKFDCNPGPFLAFFAGGGIELGGSFGDS